VIDEEAAHRSITTTINFKKEGPETFHQTKMFKYLMRTEITKLGRIIDY